VTKGVSKMPRKKTSSMWHKFFKVGGSDREFMYYTSAKNKSDLKPHIKDIKKQGDMYRVTKHKNKKRGTFFNLFDARI
jgi:hypothetical protein